LINQKKEIQGMRKYCKKGQSILEYTLILGAVIAVLVFVLLRPGGIKEKIGNAYEKTGDALEDTTNDLTGSVFGG